MDAKTYFDQKLPQVLSGSPPVASTIQAVFLVKVSGPAGGTWTLDFKANPAEVRASEGEADCTVELSDSDFETLLADPQQAMSLFFQGKLAITGDPTLATKLQDILALA